MGLGKACEIAGAEMETSARKISVLRDRLETALLSLDDTSVNGSIEKRLPHVTNISFGGVNDEALIAGINKEIAVSSGSACSSASIEPSYVLKAIGLSDEMAHSSIRFGLGKSTTEEEINYTIEKVSKTVKSLREMSPAGTIETIIKES